MSENENPVPSIAPTTREEFLEAMGRIYDEGKVDLGEQSFLLTFLPKDPDKSDMILVVGDDHFGRLEHFGMLIQWLSQVPPVQEFNKRMRAALEFAHAQEIAKKRTGLVAASHIHPGLPRA